jgi:hypothetical protein
MRKTIYLLCVAALAGCANTSPTTEPTGANADAAACIQAITTARRAATALLRADKISLAKDREIQDSLNAAVPGCHELANTRSAP